MLVLGAMDWFGRADPSSLADNGCDSSPSLTPPPPLSSGRQAGIWDVVSFRVISPQVPGFLEARDEVSLWGTLRFLLYPFQEALGMETPAGRRALWKSYTSELLFLGEVAEMLACVLRHSAPSNSL